MTASLSQGEVHLWSLPFDEGGEVCSEFLECLSEKERARARQFRFREHRDRYVLGKAALRILLGRYLCVRPEEIVIEAGNHGKPRIVMDSCRMEFSVSDSARLLVCGFARECEIGVDIERLRPLPDAVALARRFFRESEWRQLENVPGDMRAEAFFRVWTRKEAVLKATGAGLTGGLDSVAVNIDPDEKPGVLGGQLIRFGAGEWSLHDFRPLDGYIGTLAYQGINRRIRLFRIVRLERHGHLQWTGCDDGVNIRFGYSWVEPGIQSAVP